MLKMPSHQNRINNLQFISFMSLLKSQSKNSKREILEPLLSLCSLLKGLWIAFIHTSPHLNYQLHIPWCYKAKKYCQQENHISLPVSISGLCLECFFLFPTYWQSRVRRSFLLLIQPASFWHLLLLQPDLFLVPNTFTSFSIVFIIIHHVSWCVNTFCEVFSL